MKPKLPKGFDYGGSSDRWHIYQSVTLRGMDSVWDNLIVLEYALTIIRRKEKHKLQVVKNQGSLKNEKRMKIYNKHIKNKARIR